MPLVIANTTISDPPTHLADFLQNFPNFKAVSEKLCSQKAVVVGPSQLVYVGQREMAATTPTDKAIKILGTEDATTCHITVLRNVGSGATCLCHLDGCSTEAAIQEMVRLVVMLSPYHKDDRLELSLIGGFTDNRGNSEELSLSILGVLCSMKETIHLSTVCITGLNTVTRKGMPWPVIYGVGVNVGSGEIFPATFPDKGPDMALRSARHFAGGDEVLNIYEPENCQLIIGPFHYDRMRDVERWCKAPDHLIRQYLSTSPEQEPKDFEASVRESLIQIRDYPDPLVSVFTNGQGRKYDKQEDGTWKLVEHKGS